MEKESKKIVVNKGQYAILYKDDKVITKKFNTNALTINTFFDSFVGTKEEVEAKITELNLIDIPEEKVPKFDISKLNKDK